MQRLTRGIKVFFLALKLAVMERMAYRGDFFISAFFTLIGELLFPFITLVIYSSGAAFPGWTLYEILLLQGIFAIANGISFTLFHGMLFSLFRGVQDGNFDLLLIKPLPAVFALIITGFDLVNAGSILSGLVLFIFALCHLTAGGIAAWLGFIVLFLLSLAVMFSLTLFLSGTLFVWVGNGRLWEIFDVITNFGRYPASIYAVVVRTVITAVIPVAVIAFFPAAALLDRLPPGVLFTGAAVMVFLAASLLFWHRMLARYTSAGG